MGDIHLRALMSWMHNEGNYDRQLNIYRDLEKYEPLPLRAESHKPNVLLRDWLNLTYGKQKPDIREKVFALRDRVYREYQGLPYFSFQRGLAGVRSWWNRLPEAFKKIEPHNLINFEATTNRENKYMQLGHQIRRELWMPLSFQPPTILWPLYDINTTILVHLQEEHRGDYVERTRGFYYTFKSGKKGKTIVSDFRSIAKKCNA